VPGACWVNSRISAFLTPNTASLSCPCDPLDAARHDGLFDFNDAPCSRIKRQGYPCRRLGYALPASFAGSTPTQPCPPWTEKMLLHVVPPEQQQIILVDYGKHTGAITEVNGEELKPTQESNPRFMPFRRAGRIVGSMNRPNFLFVCPWNNGGKRLSWSDQHQEERARRSGRGMVFCAPGRCRQLAASEDDACLELCRPADGDRLRVRARHRNNP
jgi:hypothetical protein